MTPWRHVCITQQLCHSAPSVGVSMPCTYWPRRSWRHQPPRQRSCKKLSSSETKKELSWTFPKFSKIFFKVYVPKFFQNSKSFQIFIQIFIQAWNPDVSMFHWFFSFRRIIFFRLIELRRPRRSSVKELAMPGSWVWPNKHLPLCKI